MYQGYTNQRTWAFSNAVANDKDLIRWACEEAARHTNVGEFASYWRFLLGDWAADKLAGEFAEWTTGEIDWWDAADRWKAFLCVERLTA